MNYSPCGCGVWDPWTMVVNGTVHLFHLQRRRAGADYISETTHDSIGHATTTDLINWTEHPVALGPALEDPDDCYQPWTGCAVWHNNEGYLFYTMRGSRQPAIQRIGLARSTDGFQWTRHPGNPVIQPDPRWYSTPERPTPGTVDCRDLLVIRRPKGGWMGFYVTRQPGDELAQTSVIACVESDDLVHWRHRPPAFAPRKYACLEVPDVFPLNGRWYLTALTGDWYGNHGIFSDSHATRGTIYAVSDRPEGPYEELDDNCLVVGDLCAPLTCRTVEFGGIRYALYVDREREGRSNSEPIWFGTISTPKIVDTRGDHLVLRYSPLIESRVTDLLVDPMKPAVKHPQECWGQNWKSCPASHWSYAETISGSSQTGWGVTQFDVSGADLIYESTIEMKSGRAAGLAIRMDNSHEGIVIAYDAIDQVLYLFSPGAWNEDPTRIFRRVFHVPASRFRLKVVARREHIEGYLDDQLLLIAVRYSLREGRIGLYVDRASATFTDLRARSLRVDDPEAGTR